MDQDGTGDSTLLTIDLGTSALRTNLVMLDGKVVASTSTQCVPTYGEQGEATLDLQTVWRELISQVRRVVDTSAPPLAVGVAAQLGMVLVDDSLRPLTDAFLWSDRRATLEAQELAGTLGGDALLIAGRRVDPELVGPKLMWIGRSWPEVAERTRWVLSLKDYLVARLTGSVSMDETHASYSMLFDVRRRQWSPRLIDATGINGAWLPPVRAATDVAGHVVAEETGVSSATPVAVGGPDGTVGTLGSGAVGPGITVDVAGSSDVLLHTIDEPVADPRGQAVLNAYLLPGLWTIGGPTGMTGGAISWLAGVLGYGSAADAFAALDADMERIPPGADGLVFHTSLTGERFPTWKHGQLGRLAGLRRRHTRAHLLRAAEEGAAFLARQGIEALRRLGQEIDAVVVVGGAAHRPRSLQLRADTWRCDVLTVQNAEATSVGAAALAGVACGAYPSIPDAAARLIRHGERYVPREHNAEAMDAAYDRWSAER